MYSISGRDRRYEVAFNGNQTVEGTLDGEQFQLDIISVGTGMYHLIQNHKSYNVEVVEMNKEEKTFTIKVNGNLYPLELKDKFDLLLEKMGLEDLATSKIAEVKAPMPGLVLDVNVEPGQTIEEGDVLLVLEAMKMENAIKSPTAGIVKTVQVEKSQTVDKNAVLVEFE